MNVGRWNRYRSSRELEPAGFAHRVRRITNLCGRYNSPVIIAEVSQVHQTGANGFYCGWQYIIYNISKDGMSRRSNVYSEEFETRELAMFVADLKLIDLGFELEKPFEFINE